MKLGDGDRTRLPIFRQLDEKHLSSEADFMKWSPKMDLIAVANIQGEVTLYRLSWQKVWILQPPMEGTKVLSMAWRPDGKVLAIGYSCESILLCDTENNEILHTNKVVGSAIFLHWFLEADSSETRQDFVSKDDSTFLPKLPPLSKHFGSAERITEDQAEDSKKLGDQTQLNMLLAGTNSHWIYMFAFGIFNCFEYSLKSAVASEIGCLRSAALSDDFSLLFVVVDILDDQQPNQPLLQMMHFKLPMITSRRQEVFSLAMKYGQLSSLLGYVSTTIQSIIESWEDILLEIDTKLMNYAKEKRQTSSDTVSDDFLELLMFGTPSDALEKFLLHDLTEKGLKKLGHSIELSYSNIQKLVLKHLQNVGHALVYHLSDIQGMALWYDRFGVLGVSTEDVTRCVAEAGAFMLKATEIQLVIDNSMKNFKAFFRWMYVVILRLSDEPVTGELNKITQQDLYFVAQFLKDNFTGDTTETTDMAAAAAAADSTPTSFNLERIGQYLKNEELQFPPDTSSNPWMKFLDEHPHFKEETMLYPYHTKRSLVQQHEALKDHIHQVFSRVAKVTSQALFPWQAVALGEMKTEAPLVRQFISSSGNLFTVYSCSTLGSYFVLAQHENDGSFKAVKVKFDHLGTELFDEQGTSYSIQDLQYYNDEILSVLLMEKQSNNTNCPVLVQLSMKPLLEQIVTVEDLARNPPLGSTLESVITKTINGGHNLPIASFQRLEGMKALNLAVSGPRHVVCVMFASRHRVRLFEMDIEEEEEEVSLLPVDSEEQRSARSNDDSGVLTTTLDLSDTVMEHNDEDKENCENTF